MKPVPNIALSVLLIALCGLCAWQWNRERSLRELLQSQGSQLHAVTTERDELSARMKAADAEILRLTASIAELRTNSVAKEVHEETITAAKTQRETLAKQNAAITQQNEIITKQNGAIQQANDSIQKLTAERDSLAKRLNDVTAKFNELVKKP